MVDTSIRIRLAAAATCIAMSLAACTGGVHGSGSGGTPTEPQYTVGGTVSGLSGSGLVLATNTGETLNVSGNGSFTFKTTFPTGSPYYVLVLAQPGTPTQTCLATNSAGTVNSANVTGVTVACQNKTTTTDTIGGVVVGLTGSGLVLQNGSDTMTIAANGSFAFPTALASGTQYDISVLSPPINPYEDCAVLNGRGTTAGSDIVNIGIVCTVNSNPTYTIGGTATGVSGTLVLQDNGRDDLTLTADGPFKFTLPIPTGSSYDVTTKSAVGAQSQVCTFTNATGTVGDSNITNVTINCQANITLAASVSGLSGMGLTLQNTDNGDNLTVTANGRVTFPSGLTPGSAYNVTITQQPTNPSQTCAVANGAGTASGAPTVTVTCTTNKYTLGGVVTGLPDPSSLASGASPTSLVLQDSAGDTYTIPATANSPVSFTFPTPILSGSTYSVTVQTQPGVSTAFGASGVVQTSTVCVVSAGAGTITNANISNVAVTCVRPLGFAYVTNRGDNTISTYIIDSASGALLSSGPPVATGTAPSGAAASGTNLLYAANSGSNNVSGYTIDPNTGTLTALSGSPFALGALSAPTSLAASFSWLYASNPGAAGPGSISAATIGGSGALTDIGGSPFAARLGPTGGSFFAGGDYPTYYNYYLETDSASNTVSAYLVNGTTGSLSAASNNPAGTAPDSVVGLQTLLSSVQVDHVYVANSGDGTISIYSMNTQTGALTSLQGPVGPLVVPVESGLSSVTGAAPPTCGCFVFASGPHGVWGFGTDQTGVLTPLPNSPYAAGTGPGPITALSYDYVYVVNTVDQTISVFKIGASGTALTPVSGAAVPTGRAPSSIVVVFRPSFG